MLTKTDEVDSILRDGGNSWKNSVQRIVAHYAKDLPLQDNASYLRDEYLRGRYKYHSPTEGGKGFQFGNDKTSVWWNEDGIKIGRGTSALLARDFAFITWEQAAERIGQLYDTGHLVNHDMLEEALHNEHRELADSLLSLYRDDFRDVEAIEMPENWGYKGTWPDTTARITEFLKDKGEDGVSGEYTVILNKLREDVATFNAHEGYLSHQYHDPELTLSELERLGLEPVGFQVANIQNLNAMRFITNDEIDQFLSKGSNVSEGKMRILSHFLHDHTTKERIDFLKDEYGWGGSSWVDGHGDAEPGKGITLKRPHCENVNLKWPAVAKRIGELVQSGRYIPVEDLSKLRNYEMIILARSIKRFFETLPQEEHGQSPFGKELDFIYPKQAEWEAIRSFTEDTAAVADCVAKMQYIFDNTPEEDRHYNSRKRSFESLKSFQNGTYTLFPNIDKVQTATLENTTLAGQTSSNVINATQGESQQATIPQTANTQPGRRQSPKDLQNSGQLTLFETSHLPILPSAVEQQATIERSVEPIPEPKPVAAEAIEMATTEVTAEITAEAIEAIPENEDISEVVYNSLKLNIPYGVGSVVEAQLDNPVQMEIVKISEGYVYYDFVDDPNLNESPASMAQERFEDYLDSGGFKIISENSLETEVEPVPAQVAEPAPPSAPSFEVGDIFQIDNKPWQIEKVDDGGFIHLQNLGEPSTIAAFDKTAVHSSSFGDLIVAGKIHFVSQAKDVDPEPLSARHKAIADTAPKIPSDRDLDIVLYEMGGFYEAYGNHADRLANLLNIPLHVDTSEHANSLRYTGFPIDKLAEYTDKIQETREINFTISNLLADGTRDLTFITHPFYDLS